VTYQLSDNSKKNRSSVNPKLIEISNLALTISTVDFGHGPLSGSRTASEQKALFDSKLSMADGIKHRSMHQEGNALDFYAFKDGKASWKEEDLAVVAAAFLTASIQLGPGYEIRWGGLFKSFKDMPHVELVE